MHKLIVTILVVLALPALVSADIQSHTSASSETGGNVVGPGGKVETGNTSSSVTTTNISGKSSSSIYIKTDTNGVVHEETHTSDSSNVQVSVEATPKATVVDVKEGADAKVIQHKVIPAKAAVTTQVEPEATTSVAVADPAPATPLKEEISLGATIVLAVQSFFAGIFSWFI